MGINQTSKKKTKAQQRIPKKELDQIHELKVENTELKKEVKALQRFIKKIKSTKIVKSQTPPKKRVKALFCPECDEKLKDIKMIRPDGSFKVSSCTSCDYRSTMTKIESNQ